MSQERRAWHPGDAHCRVRPQTVNHNLLKTEFDTNQQLYANLL